MEALVAVGLASNILQFVDFAKSIVSDAKKFYENASGAKDEYQDAEGYAQRVQRLAAQVAMPQAPYGGGISVEEKELKELGERCSQIANELLEATRGVTATSHKDWVQSARKAVKASLSSSQIKSLQGRLDRISQELTGKRFQAQLQNTERALSGMAAEYRWLSSKREEDIRHLQEQLQHVTRLLEKGESQRDIAIALSAAAETGAPFTAEELIVRRLFFYGMNERHTNVHVEHEETLSWIFEEDSPVRFVEFLEAQSSLYWVSGKPGSGKSTAMKYICQHSETQRSLEKWANGNKLIVAKYFFWNAGKSSLLKSQEGLLQSILYQIFRTAPALIPKVFPDEWAAYRSGNLMASSFSTSSFSIAQLVAAISLLCAHLSDVDIRICIFIDGLDEYDGRPGDVIRLVEALKTSANLKACVSSRPWNEFERAFGQDQANKLYMQDLTKSDIRKYVRSTLENNEMFGKLLESEEDADSMALVHEIVDNAQGVFLWVVLVVRSLLEGLPNADTFSDLQRRLREFPKDLDEYFEQILFSVDDFYRKKASVMCLVTLAAAKPLPLMSYWFMDQENSRYAFDSPVESMRLQLIDSRLEAMKKRLNAYCKGLLETPNDHSDINQDAGLFHKFFGLNVNFLHRTVRDFLKIPQTQHRLLDQLPEGFNAEIAICQALVAHVKSSPQKGKWLSYEQPRKDLMDTLFLHVGTLEDETIPTQTEVEIMDEVRRIQMKDYFGEGFLLFCNHRGLLRYIYTALEREPKPSSQELTSLLAAANWGGEQNSSDLSREYSTERGSRVYGLWSDSQLQLIRRLLRMGADPNLSLNHSKGTPWMVLLDVIGEMGFIDAEKARVAVSILEEYTKHGATLQSIRGGKRGGPANYKEALQLKLTRDQFEAFLRLADSNTVSNRPADGQRKIPRVWKLLKKIGHHG